MHKKLFIPGPVDVCPEVLEQMSRPIIGHRTKDISSLQESISTKLQKIMFTDNTIILSTSSGSGLMEGAVRSFTAKRAAVFSVGAFGERWFKMCIANGVPADIFRSELGQPTTPEMVRDALSSGEYDLITVTHNETATGIQNPVGEISKVLKDFPDVTFCVDAVSSLGGAYIPVDEWKIDVCITSTQKCLALPPGMAIASVTDRAIEKAKSIPNRGLYFDYVELYKFVHEKAYQYPSTPSVSHMYALDFQLDRILNEGFMTRVDRHAQMAERVRSWATRNAALYSNPEYLSVTVSCITNTLNISFSELNAAMGKRGYLMSNGYGALKDVTFRIAHMGDNTIEDIDAMLSDLDEVIASFR
ncbi:MAG TPA: alanine--glyoxylate aminotransferase family protein [Clostridiaceae bacterium]|jgi:aspartate aminotransferase-like enzyme|nr:alanine--glyoxylate aminotransferase family protein [Clostridiaceae bacterium]